MAADFYKSSQKYPCCCLDRCWLCLDCIGNLRGVNLHKITKPTLKFYHRSSTNSFGYICIIVKTVEIYLSCSGTKTRTKIIMSTASYSYGLRLHLPILFKVCHSLIAWLISRASIRETNPYLVVATCIYIACKMEECPNHIRTVVTEARHEWAGTWKSVWTSLICWSHLIRYHKTRRMRVLCHWGNVSIYDHSSSISDITTCSQSYRLGPFRCRCRLDDN